jgi:hypothetical protein
MQQVIEAIKGADFGFMSLALIPLAILLLLWVAEHRRNRINLAGRQSGPRMPGARRAKANGRTFLDLTTGEEVKSTALARCAAAAVLLPFFIVLVAYCAALHGREDLSRGVFPGWISRKWESGIIMGVLVYLAVVLDFVRRDVHDAIARWQHRRMRQERPAKPN